MCHGGTGRSTGRPFADPRSASSRTPCRRFALPPRTRRALLAPPALAAAPGSTQNAGMRRRVVVGAGLAAVLGAAAWLGLGGGDALRKLTQGRPPNLLLVSLDTTRADRLGCYGYADARTPRLDALAARGLRFAQAVTVAPLTLPAHSSLMTGHVPRRPRRARQRRLLPRRGPGHARGVAARARLPHRRLHRRLRPRPAVGHRPGLRPLLRRLRPLEVRRRRGHGLGAAPGRRGRGPGPRVAARRTSARPSSPGSTSTIPTPPMPLPSPSRAASPGTPRAPTTPSSPGPTRSSAGSSTGWPPSGGSTAPWSSSWATTARPSAGTGSRPTASSSMTRRSTSR